MSTPHRPTPPAHRHHGTLQTLARDAAAARAALAADPGCTCGHDPSAHRRRGVGACTGLDSYGIACACPSHERHTDCDDDTP
jgi:hypothetical protein